MTKKAGTVVPAFFLGLMVPLLGCVRTALLERGMGWVLQNLRHRERSHRTASVVSYFDAGVMERKPVLHILLDHVPGAGLGFVQRVFQMRIVRAFLVTDDACFIMKVDEESGHVSAPCERP